jgi:ketosteroid isomerase-like protein
MSNRKMIWILLLVVISCVCLNSSSIFASENEEAIKAVLQQFEKAYNAKDAKAAVSVFHPNARIKTGGSRGSYVSRQEYEKRLPERMGKLGPLTYEDIEIVIKENIATIEAIILFTQSGKRIKTKYIMVLEQGKWLITDQDY